MIGCGSDLTLSYLYLKSRVVRVIEIDVKCARQKMLIPPGFDNKSGYSILRKINTIST